MAHYTDLAVNFAQRAYVTAYQGFVGAAPSAHKQVAHAWDEHYSGPYRIRGSVTIKATGQPLRRRVGLFDARNLLLVRSCWSKDDGSYEFASIAFTPWILLAQDYAGNYNAVIADQVTPEPMP